MGGVSAAHPRAAQVGNERRRLECGYVLALTSKDRPDRSLETGQVLRDWATYADRVRSMANELPRRVAGNPGDAKRRQPGTSPRTRKTENRIRRTVAHSLRRLRQSGADRVAVRPALRGLLRPIQKDLSRSAATRVRGAQRQAPAARGGAGRSHVHGRTQESAFDGGPRPPGAPPP